MQNTGKEGGLTKNAASRPHEGIEGEEGTSKEVEPFAGFYGHIKTPLERHTAKGIRKTGEAFNQRALQTKIGACSGGSASLTALEMHTNGYDYGRTFPTMK